VRRFLVENITPSLDRLTITGREARYISRVLRMKRGQDIVILDGKGQSFESTIERVSHKEVTVKVKRRLPPPPSSSIGINLCQALIKSHAMDYVIQKVTELGVDSIHPFLSERTVIRIDSTRTTAKMDRWTEIIKSACRQSNRAALPSLETPLPFQQMIAQAPEKKTLKILLWENEDRVDLKKILKFTSPLPHIYAVVGPEGGFTPNEINLARESGFHIISLGDRILRAETAAVSLVSIIQYEWGDLNLSQVSS
jgi:16S rRNA (uracil1498-N3)-methyltransferase